MKKIKSIEYKPFPVQGGYTDHILKVDLGQNEITAQRLPMDFKDKYICTACGHRLHPDSEFILCPYCGGKEIRII